MKTYYKLTASLMLLLSAYTGNAQTPVSLDSCRAITIHNNKHIKVAEEKNRRAGYTCSTAKSAHLPGVDFSGTYMYNMCSTTILESDRYLPGMRFNSETGKYEPKVLMQDGKPVMNPETGLPVFAETALLHKSEFQKKYPQYLRTRIYIDAADIYGRRD